MPIFLGNSTKNKKDIIINGTPMQKVYVGDTLVWQKQTISPVTNGFLYNWYSATDLRKITSSDTFVVPTKADFDELFLFMGNAFGQYSGKLKSTDLAVWNSPNTGAENKYNFNAVGGGNRNSSTNFAQLKNGSYYHISDKPGGQYAQMVLMYNSGNGSIAYGVATGYIGASLRFKRALTVEEQALPDGSYLTNYVGNDLKQYRVVKVGNQAWTYNIAETKYRTGDWITGFNGGVYTPISNAVWNSATTEMMCAFNDNLVNV